MTTHDLEGLIKNTLKMYAVDYNNINKNNKIDFNLTFTTHKFIAKDLQGYDPDNPKFAGTKQIDGQKLHYFRLSKILVDDNEKRVIFTSYRPVKQFKREVAKRAMLTECIRQMMIGGIEYSEAIYRMNMQKEKEQKKKKVKKTSKTSKKKITSS